MIGDGDGRHRSADIVRLEHHRLAFTGARGPSSEAIPATTVLAAILGIALVPASELSIYLPSTALFVAIYAAVWRLAAHGHPRMAAWIFIVATYLSQIGVAFGTGAVTNQMLVSFVNLILATGFFLGRRTALVVSGVSCLSVLGVSALMMFNLMPSPILVPSAMVQLVTIACTLLGTAGLTYFGVEFLTMAVERAEVNATQAELALNEIERRQRVEQRRMTRSDRLAIMARNLVGHREPAALTAEVAIDYGMPSTRPSCWSSDAADAYLQRRGWVRRTLRRKSSQPTQTEWSRRAPFRNWNGITASS